MEKNDSLYTKINVDVKARARVYLTEAKLINADVRNMKDLVEASIDEYIILHPHKRNE